MVNTTIAALGNTIAVSSGGEIRKVALGNGTLKAGNLCFIDASTSKVATTSTTAFEGIIEEKYDTAIDTAIADGASLNVIVPESNHIYRVRMADAGAGKIVGTPLKMGDGIVACVALGETADIIGYLERAIVDDDTVCYARWA